MQENQLPINEMSIAILEHVPYGIVVLDKDATVSYCNQQALDHLSITKNPSEILHLPITATLTTLPGFAKGMQNRVLKGCKPFDFTGRPFGQKFLNIRGRQLNDGMVITIEDVTSIKKLERASIATIMEGQELERRRLAKEIHDGIGPIMSTIKLHLGAIQSELKNGPDKTVQKIHTMADLIQQASDDIRSISHALMPSALVDLGLVLALDNLCQKATESEKVSVRFYHVGMEKRLELKIALSLYRIAQELLNNAYKYAEAKNINVQLIKHSKSLLLMVEDDGGGFDPANLKDLKNAGMGLRNIETRVRLLNATFNIETQLGNGVMATVEVPLN